MYKIFRQLFFLLDAETAHNLAFKLIKISFKVPGIAKILGRTPRPNENKQLFGLTFKNALGLAAGLDKNAELINEFADLGFGFLEIGTVTPQPQPGNPKPRLFRLKKDLALINRMGFNNAGVDAVIDNLKGKKHDIIIGGNIGKNKWTANDEAYRDYEICFEKLFDYVDYFVVNVSSPNTPGLRSLQDKEPLKRILKSLTEKNAEKQKPKPLLLKIAPDLTHSQIDDIIEIVKELGIDGIVATNTTISRTGLISDGKEIENYGAGGLSGKPLQDRSNEVIGYIKSKLTKIPIIGVGGIVSGKDAMEKMKAGADLIQVYTGFIYKGPPLIQQILNSIQRNNF